MSIGQPCELATSRTLTKETLWATPIYLFFVTKSRSCFSFFMVPQSAKLVEQEVRQRMKNKDRKHSIDSKSVKTSSCGPTAGLAILLLILALVPYF
jgi:hypothetical protein